MYLVTGASGHFGQATLAHLLNTLKVPAGNIIAVTRSPEKLAHLKAKGVDVRAGDFNDEAALVTAFKGATRLLLISTDDLTQPGRRQKQHEAAVRAAEKAGVAHVLYTSLQKAESSAVSFAPEHLGTENAIKSAALKGYTLLRNSWYFENLFFGIPQALASGTQYSAAGNGRIAHIARDDLARAAAAALASGQEGRFTYTLTGAAEYTTAEIAALVSKATAKPLAVVQVPLEGLTQGMIAAGVPAPLAAVFASFDDNTAKGGLSGVTGDYKALTGVEPQAFETWLTKNAAALAG
ncbi:MAG: SDR family oxidoreductase [Rhizobiales bacterium]|nr:SDR family oxidoreductase [Hyphomicrobiales bacterium]